MVIVNVYLPFFGVTFQPYLDLPNLYLSLFSNTTLPCTNLVFVLSWENKPGFNIHKNPF